MSKVNHFIWIFILLFFTSIAIYLLISHDIILFLAPRMLPMLYFGSAVFVILLIYTIISAKDVVQNYMSLFNVKYLLFFVPIVLFLTAKPDVNLVSGMSNQNVTIPYLSGVVSSSVEGGDKVYSTRTAPSDIDNIVATGQETLEDKSDNKVNVGITDIEPCILKMDERNSVFQDDFSELFSNDVMDMVGQEVSIYGFVFKYEVLDKNTIIVARKIVSCCIADAYIVGYPIRVENASDFTANDWVEVSGVVSQTETSPESGSYPYPVIVGGTIKKIEIPPVDEMYVYP